MTPVEIGGRLVGPGEPVFVIAEISANHHQDLEAARRLVHIAADAGADAVKLQTYRADSMTLDVDTDFHTVGPGTVWEGRRLYELYEEAATPFEWFPILAEEAVAAGIVAFSTPFDIEAVDYLAEHDPPAFKIASFELVDTGLIARAAATGKPLIMSTGMASADEIDAAMAAATTAGDGGVVLLRCNSAYPAPPTEMDLRTIGDMEARWEVPVGLSDHTVDDTAALVAVSLGACVLEKHFMERRSDGGPDSGFSLEPDELRATIERVRLVERALGTVRYGPSPTEAPSLAFRRSLWWTADAPAGAEVAEELVGTLRPAGGLEPARRSEVVGRRLRRPVRRGDPVSTDDVR